MKITDLNGKSKDELYKIGRSYVDKLDKRRKALRLAYDTDPTSVSTYGLNKLELELPRPSKKSHINVLKAQIVKLADIDQMKTTTVRGAKQQQERMFRTIANVPVTGRLTPQQRRKVDYQRDMMRQNQDLITDYWNAYEHFRTLNEANFKYDPEKTLEAFQNFYDQQSNLDPVALHNAVRESVRQMNADINRKSNAMNIGRLRNQFIAPDEE